MSKVWEHRRILTNKRVQPEVAQREADVEVPGLWLEVFR